MLSHSLFTRDLDLSGDSLRLAVYKAALDLCPLKSYLQTLGEDGYASTFSFLRRRNDLGIDWQRINFDWSSPSSQVPGPLHSRPSKFVK